MTTRAPFFLAALLACASSARALSIRSTKAQIARAADGSKLIEVREDGPEGGGALTYRVQGKTPGDVVDFVVSSDFSPGDGSTPQTVSAETCRQRLAALDAELTKRKIPGVALHPEGCTSARRAGLAVVK